MRLCKQTSAKIITFLASAARRIVVSYSNKSIEDEWPKVVDNRNESEPFHFFPFNLINNS